MPLLRNDSPRRVAVAAARRVAVIAAAASPGAPIVARSPFVKAFSTFTVAAWNSWGALKVGDDKCPHSRGCTRLCASCVAIFWCKGIQLRKMISHSSCVCGRYILDKRFGRRVQEAYRIDCSARSTGCTRRIDGEAFHVSFVSCISFPFSL